MATNPRETDRSLPPGDYINEVMQDLGMTKGDVAGRTGRTPLYINDLVYGKRPITGEIAFELENVLKIPAEDLLKREYDYRITAETKDWASRLEAQEETARLYPYDEIAKLGYVPSTRKPYERVRFLLGFFGMAHLKLVEQIYGAVFSATLSGGPTAYSLAAWLRTGEIEADRIDCARFNRARLRRVVKDLRRAIPAEFKFNDALRRTLANAGVKLIIAQQPSKSNIHGAAYWHGNHAIIMLTAREAFSDVLWLELLNYISHLLLHAPGQFFVDGINLNTHLEDETRFSARDTLIPPAYWKRFETVGDFTPSSIRKLSWQVDTSPSIVVGRLVKERPSLSGNAELQALRERTSIS